LSTLRPGGRERAVAAERTRDVHFGGHGWVSSRVVDRNALAPGDTVAGPAIVDQLDSTIVLPPGTTAVVDAIGNVIVSIDGKEAAT
jgi:N-methylhydantoinase A